MKLKQTSIFSALFGVIAALFLVGCGSTTVVKEDNRKTFTTVSLCVFAYEAEKLPGWVVDPREVKTILEELSSRGLSSNEACTSNGYAKLMCSHGTEQIEECSYREILNFQIERMKTFAAYTSPNKDRKYMTEISDLAMEYVVICGKANVAKLDDKVSDSISIARALSATCRKEYEFSSTAIGYAYAQNAHQFELITLKRNAIQSKVDTFLPIVLKNRQNLLEKKRPSPETGSGKNLNPI